MSEVEKKESQKTVVAFVTGLLIGGLLVWVFSSTPNNSAEPTKDEVNVDSTSEEITKEEGETSRLTEAETEAKAEPIVNMVGEGALTVDDQKAGNVVLINVSKYPTKSGWVAVREVKDGVLGNILGTARYNMDEGLTAQSIELLRDTTVGGSYQVLFYTNEGALNFTLGEDKLIEGVNATFKAN